MASLQPEILFSSHGVNFTNTLAATLVTDFILVALVFIIAKNAKLIPGKLQNIAELAVSYFYDLTESVAGKNTKKIFPWVASFFIFIFFANAIALLPGFGTVGFFKTIPGGHEKEFIPLLRAANSDFNVTLALATVSLVVTHAIAVRAVGIKRYIGRYLSFNPIYLYVGLLEVISEFTKLFSLSFRLFGNIYAGEVVLSTISSLFAFVAPIPFILLEIIVALVQALVFSLLTMVFMSVLATPHGEGGEH
ncbi:MAG: F0F1 ATP synthase subunit A [Candidatus Levyibacteriota bacterium]